eukprot:s583_g6.t1
MNSNCVDSQPRLVVKACARALRRFRARRALKFLGVLGVPPVTPYTSVGRPSWLRPKQSTAPFGVDLGPVGGPEKPPDLHISGRGTAPKLSLVGSPPRKRHVEAEEFVLARVQGVTTKTDTAQLDTGP